MTAKRLNEKIKKDRLIAGLMGIDAQIVSGRDLSKSFENCRYGPTKDIKEQPDNLTTDKSRLIGHCFFDGWVSEDYESFTISYCSVVEGQVEYFRNLIKTVYGLESTKEFNEGKYVTRVSGKNAVIDLLYYSPSYSTKLDTGALIPDEILNASEEIKISFLKAFWNDEGCIVCNRIIDKNGYAHFCRELEGSIENYAIRSGLVKLHLDLGLNPRVNGTKIILSGIDNLKLFKQKIDFESFARVSKNYDSVWFGVSKNKILEHIINTYINLPKAYIATFGCVANKTDSNSIEGILFKSGFELINELEKAEYIIVNTCAVKGVTQNKIISFLKNLPKNKMVLVGGCLTKVIDINKYANANFKIFDTNTICQLNQLIFGENNVLFSPKKESRLYLINLDLPKKNETFNLPLSQGCLDACYYCATKISRGHLKSYTREELVKKAKEAITKGYKLLHLTSQDNSCYGFDINDNLAFLLEELVNLDGDFKIRVGMMHPRHLPKFLDQLIEVYKNPKIIKFLHVPIQSGSDKVLKEMNRQGTVAEYKAIVGRFRKEIPEIHISTDIIVGYPTETEEDFQETLNLVKELKFEVMNISKFASRTGTHASRLKQLPSQMIKQRGIRLTELFNQIKNERFTDRH